MVQINKKWVTFKFLISYFYLFSSCSYVYHIWLFPRLIHLSGDIEKNPGSKKNFSQRFSSGHWNLNNFNWIAHSFTRVALLKAYLSVLRFDIFCISEPYLNSSTTKDDYSLRIPGYDLIRSDHPSNNKEEALRFITKIFFFWNE